MLPSQQDTKPTVSAVITNHNGGQAVLKCLAALYAQPVPLRTVLVVDNGSSDGSPQAIRAAFPEARLLELGENRGLPAARNAGLRAVQSDLVLLLDDDVYLDEGCLPRLLMSREHSGAAVLCPRIVLHPQRDTLQCDGAEPHFIGALRLRRAYAPLAGAPSEPGFVGGCIGACMLLERRAALEAGGFDEDFFFYLEDLEFSLRMRALGHRFYCDPLAVAYHDRGEGTPDLSFRGLGAYPRRRAYLTMRHRLMAVLIHYRARTLLALLPALTLYEAAAFAAALGRGWLVEWLRAYLSPLRAAPSLWARRRRVQRARRVDDKDLLCGGPLPLAPGFLRSSLAKRAAAALSSTLDNYWRLIRPLVA